MQRFCHPGFVFPLARGEITFAGRATNHQDAHGQEPRELSSDKIDNCPDFAGNAFDQILSDKENRLRGANNAGGILQHHVMKFEVVVQSSFEHLVIAVVLVMALKRLLPGVVIL